MAGKGVAFLPDRLFKADTDQVVSGLAVWVDGSHIKAVLPPGEVPADVRVERLPGATLLPGLIDAHVHLDLPGDGGRFEALDEDDTTLAVAAAAHARIALEAGVTTVRDCGSRGRTVLGARQAINKGWFEAATIRSAYTPMTVPRGHTWPMGGEASGIEGCREAVRQHHAAGADFIKVIGSGGGTPGTHSWQPSFSQEELDAIVAEAHGLGLRVTVHCLCGEAMRRAARAGADQVEHGQFYAEDDSLHVEPEVIDAMAAAGVALTPTLIVAHQQVAELEAEADPGPDLDRWRRMADDWRESAATMHRAGVRLVAGTDAGWRFVGFQALAGEIGQLRAVGLSAGESLRAATSTASEVMALGKVGRIEAGWQADLLAVDGDPVQDVRALETVRLVVRQGRVVHRPLTEKASSLA